MPGSDDLAALVSRLEAVAVRLEAAGGEGAGDSEAGDNSATLSAFNDILSGSFAEFNKLCAEIGGDVAKAGIMLAAAMSAQKDFLTIVAKSKEPQGQLIQGLLKPTADKISEIQAFREKNRRSEFFNHLSALSESVSALGWVTVSPAPAPFVKEMNDAGQFYTNRVLKDWKEKDTKHVAWVKSWVSTLTQLQALVKQYHTTGLVWNPSGGIASLKTSAPPPPPAGGPPPPPPGPPPPPAGGPPPPTSSGGSSASRGALLDCLNKGSDVTKGLKKVDQSQMTHKNPELRETGVVKAQAKEKTSSPSSTAQYGKASSSVKPPKFELDGKKWVVEYQKGNKDLDIASIENNQSVYMYKCEASTLKINGKCNNIIIDSCKKVAIVFETVVGSIEFINCQSVKMQVLGKVPTISVEKTDGCQMYLNKESVNVEIISAKSSEMNVMIPVGDDFVEQPVAEQFKTVIEGSKLKTTMTESV